MKSSRIRLLAKVKKSQNQNFKGSKQKFKKTQKYQNLPHGPLLSFIKTLRATSSSSLYYLLLLFLLAVVGWLVAHIFLIMSTGTATQSSVHALTCQTKCSQVNAENVTNEREREEVRNEWMKEGFLKGKLIAFPSDERVKVTNKMWNKFASSGGRKMPLFEISLKALFY